MRKTVFKLNLKVKLNSTGARLAGFFFTKLNFVRTFRGEFLHILLPEKFQCILNTKILFYNILKTEYGIPQIIIKSEILISLLRDVFWNCLR